MLLNIPEVTRLLWQKPAILYEAQSYNYVHHSLINGEKFCPNHLTFIVYVMEEIKSWTMHQCSWIHL